MRMFSAPSPAPPTVLRSTAGLSGLIVPYSLPVSDGAAVALGDDAAGADADACDAALAAGDGDAPPVQAARTTASDAMAAESDRAFIPCLLHPRSEEHTSELQSLRHLVCRLLLEKKNTRRYTHQIPRYSTT